MAGFVPVHFFFIFNVCSPMSSNMLLTIHVWIWENHNPLAAYTSYFQHIHKMATENLANLSVASV